MDELLSLFNADDNAGYNDTSHQETQPAVQTRKTKYQGAPSLSTTNSNDFGSSFASAFATSNTNSRTTNEENVLNKSRVAKQHQSYTTTKSSTTNIQKHKSNTTCDPYTNFVITDRRTSRANMVNAFSTLTYKSCSILAASSRAEWCTFLVDGHGGSNNGAPSGKTKLATCGILTQDVSSKLSSKTGRAFAKLSLGDLPSSSSSNNMYSTIAIGSNNINPSITVFLFGDAINILKSNMKYMKAGYAIAILQPNLMPNNNNSGGSGTSITLSINNPSQLLPIGRASDCNKCMGTHRVRTQSEYGGVKWEDVRCTTLVDCRFGLYCDKHKKQGLGNGVRKSNSSNNKGNTSMTFMQKQRMQQQQGMSQMRGNNNRGDIWVGKRGGHTNASSFNNLGHQGGRSTSSSLSEALSQSGILGQQSATPSLGSRQQLLKRAPLHMKKSSQPISSFTTGGVTNKLAPAMASTNSSSTTKNPYSYKSSQSKSSNSRKRKDVDDILGEALDRTTSSDQSKMRPGKMMKKKTSLLSSSTTTKRPVKVFTTEGYDGAVHVPKPNKLLFQRGASSSLAASSMVTPSPDDNRLSSALILDKQRNLAELLKRKQSGISTTPATNMKRGLSINKDTLARSKQKIVSTTAGGIKVIKRPTNSSQSKTNKYDDFASAFGITGSGGSLSTEADIMNAKSRFSSATNAQEYARARAQVQELEAREATKEGYNKKKKNKASDVAIRTTGWACRTCKKTTPFKPVGCINARHDVRQKREIKGQETLSKRKDRLDRHGKDDKEGGLTLGSGVEWTRLEWSRGGL